MFWADISHYFTMHEESDLKRLTVFKNFVMEMTKTISQNSSSETAAM